jgi:hypothetical protein
MGYSKRMEGTPEEKVLAYIESHSNKTLVFYPLPDPPDNVNNVRDLIIFVLRSSKYCQSRFLKPDKFQCYNSRNRSVVDIWRHIKYYNDTIDLFSVMRTIVNIRCARAYCDQVRKRVFFYRQPDQSFYVMDDDLLDEFGLCIDDWKQIGLNNE